MSRSGWIWVGALLAAMVIGGACEGPTGPQGAKGDHGHDGTPGEDGLDGIALLWAWQAEIDDCDLWLSPPESVRAAIRGGHTLCLFEVELIDSTGAYWVSTPVVWWFDQDYPEAQTILLIHEGGDLLLWNGCGGRARIRILGFN
jgi:hypothetical protein